MTMSTDQLHDFNKNPFSDSALGGLMEVDLGTYLPSGVQFFRERLRKTTRRTDTRLDDGKGPLGSGSGLIWIATISCILTDLIPCK
jgi:hypothetical protein